MHCAEGVRIEYADDAGLRYAEATLAQIRAQSRERLPGLHLRDAPDFVPARNNLASLQRALDARGDR